MDRNADGWLAFLYLSPFDYFLMAHFVIVLHFYCAPTALLIYSTLYSPLADEVCPRCKFANESASVMFCGGCGTRLNSTQAQRKLYHTLGTLIVSGTFYKNC